jgi:magnesium-transporting ATPase (P-type)
MPDDPAGTNPCMGDSNINYVSFIDAFLKMVIVCITLVVAIIPEALPLAFGVTINTYSKQAIMSS